MKNIRRAIILFAVVVVAIQITPTHVFAADYLLPSSATVYLNEADVAGFSQQKLNYARNEIYARHGRKFVSQELTDYFNTTDWYEGTISPEEFDELVLNDYERANANFLRKLEYNNDPDGYVLDVLGYNIYAVQTENEYNDDGSDAVDNVSGNDNDADIPSSVLTKRQAYDAIFDYLDDSLGMDTVYNYHGYLCYSDNTDEEYVFFFRSYTGAQAYYYVNAFTGDVYEEQENPIIMVYQEKEYLFNIFGYEPPASVLDQPEYELMTEDNTYFTTMLTETHGEPDGNMNTVFTYACDYAYENNTFILTGSLLLCEWNEELHSVWPEFDQEHFLQNKVRGFICDEQTQFMAVSGESPIIYYSPEEFVENALKCKDTGLGLTIEVYNGKASAIKISS